MNYHRIADTNILALDFTFVVQRCHLNSTASNVNRLEHGNRRGRTRAATASPQDKELCMKEKEEKLEVEGEVIEALRSRMFRVRLDNGHEALGYMGGKMKRYRIRVFPGDRVRIELSSYDLTRGRIVYRLS